MTHLRPDPLRGAAIVGLGGVYAGALEEGEKILRPLREYGPPLADMFQPMPYNAAQRMADFLWPAGLHSCWKSSYLKTLSDDAIDVVVDSFARVPSRRTVIVLEHNGDSAWDRVPDSATAIRASSLAVQLRRHLRLVRSEGCGTEHRLDARVLRRHAPIRGTRCLRELPWW